MVDKEERKTVNKRVIAKTQTADGKLTNCIETHKHISYTVVFATV